MTDPVRTRLEGELLNAYQRINELEATQRLASHQASLLKPRRPRWPVRLLWGGWPTRLHLDRIGRPGNGAAWIARWSADQWYAVLQYVRIGPVILELGRRPDLDAAREQELALFRRLHGSARPNAEQRLASLRRHLDWVRDHH